MFRRASERNMGYLPQGTGAFFKKNSRSNRTSRALFGNYSVSIDKRRKERTDELLEEFNITHIRKGPAGGFEAVGGGRRRFGDRSLSRLEPRNRDARRTVRRESILSRSMRSKASSRAP